MAKGEASLLVKIQTAGEEALTSLKGSLETIGKVGMIAFAAISGVVVKAIGEFQEQEKATNELNQSLINSGIYTKQLSNDYKAQADAVGELTLFKGEQITAAQATLQSNLGEMKVTKELTMAVADLAQKKGIDLVTAADMVGKAIGTNTNALARQGIEVNTNASKQEKLAQVISGLNGKFGGQAVAATEGMGALQKFRNSIDDAFEAIGERIAPAITTFISQIMSMAGPIKEADFLMDAFSFTVNTLLKTGILAGGIMDALGKTIGTVLAGALGTVGEILQGNFKKAWDTAKLAATTTATDIGNVYDGMANKMIAIDDAYAKSKEQQQAKELVMTQQAIENKTAVVQKSLDDEFVLRETKRQEEQLARAEMDAAELAAIGGHQDAVLRLKMESLDKQIAAATSASQKAALLREKSDLVDKLAEETRAKQKEQLQKDTFATIASLASSNNSTLATIGKAAALTQIAIDTPMAVSKALAAFPPPFNFAAAGAVGAAMAAQAAQVAGIKLAEGGVVMPRPGGTQAIIGEAGQPEAVIPLDKMGGMGGGITINVNGGLLGDPSSAREFAIAVDRQLLELRRNNESVSFDERVI